MSFRPAWASFILAMSLLPVGTGWGMEAQRADGASADPAKPALLSIIPWPSRVPDSALTQAEFRCHAIGFGN